MSGLDGRGQDPSGAAFVTGKSARPEGFEPPTNGFGGRVATRLFEGRDHGEPLFCSAELALPVSVTVSLIV